MQQTDNMCKIWIRNNISYKSDSNSSTTWDAIHDALYIHMYDHLRLLHFCLHAQLHFYSFLIRYWKSHFCIYPWVSGVTCASRGNWMSQTNADLAETAASNVMSFLELRPLERTVNKDRKIFLREIQLCACLNSSASPMQSNGHGVHTQTQLNSCAQQNDIPHLQWIYKD